MAILPPKKPSGLSGFSGLSGLGGKDNKKEDDKAPKKLSLPKSTIIPSKGVDPNGMGKELLVKDAAGIVMDSIYQSLLKLPSGALSDSRTFRMINNSGTKHMIDSTLGVKLSDEERWLQFNQTINDINTLLNKVGQNKADRFRTKRDKKGVIDMKSKEMAETTERVEGNKGDCSNLEVVENEGKKEQELNMQQENRILFIKDLTDEQRHYLTGYEVYASDSRNAGIKGNPQLWDKWNDENIIRLIEKGAKVTWLAPDAGPLANEKITWEANDVEFLRYIIDKNIFSFHQVYVPKNIPVLEKIKKIGKDVEQAIEKGIDLNSLLKKSEKKFGGPIIEEPDDGIEFTDVDPRYTFRNLFPKNPQGKYVDTTILESPQMMSIENIGTGMQKLMKPGGFKELYLGIEPVENIMNTVIGESNYQLLVGSVLIISMENDTDLEGKELEIDFSEDSDKTNIGEIQKKTDSTRYFRKKEAKSSNAKVSSNANNCFELVRGIYIDRLGNFKICQIVVDVKIGDDIEHYSQVATAKQLASRSLLTTVFPLFSSISEKDTEKYTQRIEDVRATNDFLERRNIMLKAYAEIEQSREARMELLTRKRIKGDEVNLIMECDEKEYLPKRILDIEYDPLKTMNEGESKREQERINQMVEEDMRNTREALLREREEQKRMEEERPADVHYHDANGEYIGVNKEEQREIEQQIRNRNIQMAQERKEGEN